MGLLVSHLVTEIAPSGKHQLPRVRGERAQVEIGAWVLAQLVL